MESSTGNRSTAHAKDPLVWQTIQLMLPGLSTQVGNAMVIREIIWLDEVVAKLEAKHHVSTNEVEDVLREKPMLRRLERGRIAGEDLYVALGCTEAGRYLTVFFLRKGRSRGLVISARDMDAKERRLYGRG